MVMLKTVFWATFGITSVLIAIPGRVDACSPPHLLGRVKSVIETEALVDPLTGKIADARLADRIDISSDGSVTEMTVYSPQRPTDVTSKFTAYFESGRPTREIETVGGKPVSTRTCSYDPQGRLMEERTQSDTGEINIVEAYEYGAGFIRRRSRVFGQWHVTNQILDALGRVVKEVTAAEARPTDQKITEFTYTGTRQEECRTTSSDPRRHCITTIRDSRGNEVELLAEGQSRKTTFEYDSGGNWISKRTTSTGPGPNPVIETIVRRTIEYW